MIWGRSPDRTTDATGYSHGFLRSPDGKFTTFEVPGAGGYGTNPIAH